MPAKWVTEVESEFDANERDSWYAFWEYEQALCPQCGRLRSICEDPNTPFNPQITTCHAVLRQTMHTRWWHKKYESVKPDSDGWHPTDGGLVWVSEDLPPEPLFGLKPEADVSSSQSG